MKRLFADSDECPGTECVFWDGDECPGTECVFWDSDECPGTACVFWDRVWAPRAVGAYNELDELCAKILRVADWRLGPEEAMRWLATVDACTDANLCVYAE